MASDFLFNHLNCGKKLEYFDLNLLQQFLR
jgi:hypothetical protein